LASTSVEAVENTLIFGKVVPFAGHYRNEGLGRSVTVRQGSLPQTNGRADDSRVFFGRRGGERRQRAQTRHTHPTRAAKKNAERASGDTSFTRSKGPCTSIATTLRAAQVERRWRGFRGIAVGQTHGSGRNQHRGHGNRTNHARLAAHHRSLRGCSVVRIRKGRRLRPPSLRGNESSGECPYVVSSCRSHQASSGLEYATCSAPKRVATSVNRDLARSNRRP
jgi:hypothetical protein